MDDVIELTKCQDSGLKILEKMDEENDPSKIKAYAEAYKAIKEADAKEVEVNTKWSLACLEDDREKRNLEFEEKKLKRDTTIHTIDKMLDTTGKALTGAAVFGVAAVGTKAVIEMEEKGLFASNILTKEFMSKVVKDSLGWIFKIFRH